MGVGLWQIRASSITSEDPIPSSPGCTNDDIINFEIQPQPTIPILVDNIGTVGDDIFDGIGQLAAGEYTLEYCSGETVADFVINTPAGTYDGVTYKWYNDAGGLSVIDADLNNTLSASDLFGGTNAPTGRISRTFYFSTFTDTNLFDGCESTLRKVTIEIYPSPNTPVVNLAGTAAGSSAGTNDYVFEYCATTTATLENIVLNTTLDTDEPAETYLSPSYGDDGAGSIDLGNLLFTSTNNSFDPTLVTGS